MELHEAEKYFNTEKNNLSFDMLTPGSAKKVHLICPQNHEWEQPFRNFLKTHGCQYCSGRKIILGFNDLKTLHPEIASQIHPTKNVVNVLQQPFNSNHSVWWKCERGHEWETKISKRVYRGDGCPTCSNRQIILGFNDLKTLHPKIASQIHPTKNVNRDTQHVSPSSSKKLWWVCDKNHEWEATIDNRTSKNRGCPVCKNKTVLPGFNDIPTTHPDLLTYWDYTQNPDPHTLFAGSSTKVQWKDNKGHEWERSVNSQRTNNTCPVCSGRLVVKNVNDLTTTHPHLITEWNFTRNQLLPSDFSYGSDTPVWWVCEKEHEWETTITNRAKGTACPTCWGTRFQSHPENTIKEWLQENQFNVRSSVRSLIKSREIDLFIPEQNLAIEFNGVYWHSEAAGKTKTYHYDKWLACKKQGIQLIQIWEDDWNRNPELIKRMLTHKLGATSEPKVYARNTTVVSIRKTEAQLFLNQNHIQGFASGTHYLALRETYVSEEVSQLVAVMVLKKEPATATLNLVRYATSKTVPGGFTKLLKHTISTFNPGKISTFSDNTVSDGGLYKNNGFTVVKELDPDYMYVVKGQRVHKFNYRLKRFKTDPELQYVEGYTETQLAYLNKLTRIWDAGKIKWELSLQKK